MLLNIQSLAQLVKTAPDVNLTITQSLQVQLVLTLANISSSQIAIPQDDAIIQAETLERIVNLAVLQPISPTALSIATNVVTQVTLTEGETIDTRLSQAIISTLSEVITSKN